jgi:cellulose synthase/poly-beta-1,6-N-acetylglucosamine synthase-like glycosyltransferase
VILSGIFAVIAVVLVVATLPLLVELLVLTGAALLPDAKVRKRAAGSEPPSLSILIPAHNEEALIGRCIRALTASTGAGAEVVVVAHNCIDSTAAQAANAGARVLVLDDPNQRGKGCALSFGFASILAGNSHAVLVIDADSVVDAGLIAEVRRRLRAGERALQCRYEVYNCHDSRRTRLMTLALYAANVVRPRGRARLGLSAGILGNGFAIHRDVLTRIPYGAHSVVEDLEYHLTLVRAGIRVEFIDEATVRGEMPVTPKGAQAQRARWEGGRLRMMRRLAPGLIADILCGKASQIEPLLDLLALPIASEIILLLVTACLPFAWSSVYVLVAFAVLLFHLTVAALEGPGIWETMKALSSVPAYILWKLWMLPEIWRTTRAGAAWVRTERESPANGR